ncbi:MAG TPA: hypothetical protein VGK49_00780, partial [Ilumatobacteraceae bacterium]
GVDPAAFAAIDIGLKRTGGDALGTIGATQGKDLAAVIRMIAIHDSLTRTATGWSTRSTSIDTDEIVEVYEADPPEWQTCVSVQNQAKHWAKSVGLKLVSPSAIGAFAHLAHRAGHAPDDVVGFVEFVVKDENHTAGNPATSLRRWLAGTALSRTGGVDHGLVVLSGWVRAFNATLGAEPLHKIYSWSRASQTYPSVAGAA